jgi:hypothetical protein
VSGAVGDEFFKWLSPLNGRYQTVRLYIVEECNLNFHCPFENLLRSFCTWINTLKSTRKKSGCLCAHHKDEWSECFYNSTDSLHNTRWSWVKNSRPVCLSPQKEPLHPLTGRVEGLHVWCGPFKNNCFVLPTVQPRIFSCPARSAVATPTALRRLLPLAIGRLQCMAMYKLFLHWA